MHYYKTYPITIIWVVHTIVSSPTHGTSIHLNYIYFEDISHVNLYFVTCLNGTIVWLQYLYVPALSPFLLWSLHLLFLYIVVVQLSKYNYQQSKCCKFMQWLPYKLVIFKQKTPQLCGSYCTLITDFWRSTLSHCMWSNWKASCMWSM